MEKVRVAQVDGDGVLLPEVEVYAEPNPFNPDELLYPAGTRASPVPPLLSNQAARTTGPDVHAAWEVVDDYRGLTYWTSDGTEVRISQVGITPPLSAHYSKPPPTPKQLADRRTAEIKLELAQIDSDGARPAREIAIALASGSTPPPAAVSKVTGLEAAAQLLRAELATLAEVL